MGAEEKMMLATPTMFKMELSFTLHFQLVYLIQQCSTYLLLVTTGFLSPSMLVLLPILARNVYELHESKGLHFILTEQ